MKFIHILITLLFITSFLQAQEHSDTINYSFNGRINVGSGTYAPFLSTANEYDRYSFAPNSLTLWGTLHKKLQTSRSFDYGFGVELDGNIAKTENRFFPEELYIQGKVYFLNLYVGCKREVFGNQDTELSSGGMLWSQNSRPMPKISIQTNGFINVPYTKGYVAVKGGLSHGWFNNSIGTNNLLLHHKYAYIKLGGSFPLNINYGLQHVAQWGGDSMPVTLDNYKRIFLGKSGNSTANMSDQINTLGNHIVSQNLGLDLNLKSIIISVYWQNITEDPPVRFITQEPNIADGLWGLSVKLPYFKPFHSFVFEFMSTTDQTGPWHDLDGVIYGGADGYYYNGQIPGGWSYRKMTIGNPWITSPKYIRDGSELISNNIVRLFYFSGMGEYKSLNYKIKIAYSQNYGLANPSIGNNPFSQGCKKQYSYQFESSTPLIFIKNTKASLGIAGDIGTMYGTNFAILLGISYSGIFGL